MELVWVHLKFVSIFIFYIKNLVILYSACQSGCNLFVQHVDLFTLVKVTTFISALDVFLCLVLISRFYCWHCQNFSFWVTLKYLSGQCPICIKRWSEHSLFRKPEINYFKRKLNLKAFQKGVKRNVDFSCHPQGSSESLWVFTPRCFCTKKLLLGLHSKMQHRSPQYSVYLNHCQIRFRWWKNSLFCGCIMDSCQLSLLLVLSVYYSVWSFHEIC